MTLDRLIQAVPPPENPLLSDHGVGQSDDILQLPDDFLELVSVYGSGAFHYRGDTDLIRLNNPNDDEWSARLEFRLDIIRSFKETEGDDYVPYDIYPDSPGLLPWGWGDNRNYFFWHTSGSPNDWPVVMMGDFEEFSTFEMRATEFILRLASGDISAQLLGISRPDDRFAPGEIIFRSFVSSWW